MKFKSLLKSKKGILGLETVKGVVLALLTLAILVIAALLALVSLQNAGIFTAASVGQNATRDIVGNVSVGSSTFFGYIPTFFILLAVVVIILIISIVIVAVTRFGGGTARESL